MKHTQGKWLIHPHVDTEYSIFNETGTAHICDVTTEADAKLIAAAPELLEAAIDTLKWLKEYHRASEPGFFENLKSAIKKATE